jgi:hypothetical protein
MGLLKKINIWKIVEWGFLMPAVWLLCILAMLALGLIMLIFLPFWLGDAVTKNTHYRPVL